MIRQAVGAVIVSKNTILLVHKVKIGAVKTEDITIPGEWDFPKGGLEADDVDLESALLRELQEETGSTNYEILSQLPEKICFSFPPALAAKLGLERQETTMFLVRYCGDGTDLQPNDEEIDQLAFIPFAEISEKLTHQDTKDFWAKIHTLLPTDQ
ncbi:NUDIX domain-containing protein [Mangrovibacillus cuniculi]|uniref:NUDIX hydrolase n=1 Tax=Mangrovibacillus cuniculi TaxID=2593652 RepID=A0A7S8HEB6_9BACI|nr:NUDIX hydrolase [Mangrovibacillus cuniculi]QPC45547.1 NUDIX hydrolase [Mangrovibacillus cuniculi]